MMTGQLDTSVAIIIGNAHHDGLLDVGLRADREDLRAFFSRCYPKNSSLAQQAFQLYDPGDGATPELGWTASYWAARQVATDWDMTCVARRAAMTWSKSQLAPAYWYQWDFVAPFPDFAMQEMAKASEAVPHGVTKGCWPCPGAGHGSELPFLFEGTPALHFLNPEIRETLASGYPILEGSPGMSLGLGLREMWATFATRHKPQADNMPPWQAVQSEQKGHKRRLQAVQSE